MKIKRLIIPTLTMAIIASQLMGCSALTQSELLKWINEGRQIEIDVATPVFYESKQGEESALVWVELAQLETNPALRGRWDDTLLITRTDTGKNGILYVNAAGENENNNTLFVALHNREVQKIFEDDSTMKSLADSVVNNYTDIEIADSNNRNERMKAVYMGINGYFNLLPDNTPNYSNADSTVTRAQFMAMVYRADTPVQEISANSTFTELVGQSDYNLYSQEVAENSYLDLSSKSLNNMTYNGNITRAEVIYILISRYYNDELQAVNPANSGVAFSDAKDGGDIASAQKFIEGGNAKDYWKSYELTYALQNPDQGLPTDLYKAMIVAYQNNIITTETRWDEAITLSEAMELLIKAIMNEKGTETYTAKIGSVNGYEVDNEEDNIQSDNNTTFQGNGSGVDLVIPDDFPYVDRSEAEVIETPAPEIVEQPKVEQPKQEVQQPVQTSTPVNSMPTRTDGGGVPSAPTGTGDGNGAGNSAGGYE